jgi:hypothetical protein
MNAERSRSECSAVQPELVMAHERVMPSTDPVVGSLPNQDEQLTKGWGEPREPFND